MFTVVSVDHKGVERTRGGILNVVAKTCCIFQRFKAECDQNKQFLKAMKDYNKELLEQRHKNAEQDKETEKLRVNMLAFI